MDVTLQEAISYIEKIDELDDAEKSKFIEMVRSGENPADVLERIEDNLEGKLEQVFREEGVEIDPKDPEFKAAEKEMSDEIKAAEDEFTKEMESIETQSHDIHEESVKQSDDLKIQALKDKLSEK